MGDDEGHERKSEDLFEDLDRFFAPIQGVDWPEVPEEEDEAPAGAAPEPARVPAEPEPSEPEMGEMPPAEPAAEPSQIVHVEPEDERYSTEGVVDDEWSAEERALDDEPDERSRASGTSLPVEEEATAADVEAAAEHFASSVREDASETYAIGETDGPDAAPRTVKVDSDTDDLRGPSWQEPTSEDVTVGTTTAPGGRNVPAAFLTGIVLAAVVLASLKISRGAFAVVASLVVLVAQGELYAAMTKHHRHQPATIIGLMFGALTLAAAYLKGEAAMLSMAAVAVVFSFIWHMALPLRARKDVMGNIALTIFGLVYVPLLAGFGLVIVSYEPSGRALLLAVLVLTFVYDTVAFGVGTLWGDRPLAPNISPRKSWEGAIIASLAVLIAAMAVVPTIHGIHWTGAVGIAFVVAVLAPLGDLAESVLKRDLGLKDMGSILPGHGGVLDRIDSALFVLPGALIVLRMILKA